MALFDDASLVVTPNGYKEGTLYSIKPTSGAGDMTVVRATTATRVNSAGLIELVPYNLLERSQEFGNAYWTAEAGNTITSNTTTAPDGTLTADTFTATASNEINVHNSGPLNLLGTFTYSIYLKNNGTNLIEAYLFKVGVGFAARGEINFSAGTFTASVGTGTIENVGNGWFRVSLTNTYTAGTFTTGTYTTSTTGTRSVYAWGAQLVEGTLLLDYLRTETRLNIPRLDYSNGSCPSLLVEPQRTNLALYSEQFDNAGWIKSSSVGTVTVTANNTTSPDGTNNADRIVFPATPSGYSVVDFPFTATAANYTGSFYFKGLSGGETIWISYTKDGVNYNRAICNLTTSWQRFNLSALLTAGGDNFQFGVDTRDASQSPQGSQTVFAWGAQLELGTYPTSYIPTTSAAVTRNADVIYKTGISSLIGQTEGTLFADYVTNNQDASARIISVSDGSFANRIVLLKDGGSIRVFVGTASVGQVDISFGTWLGSHKIAVAYANNDLVVFLDGIQVATDTSINVPACSAVQIGTLEDNSNGAPLGGSINLAVLFPTRLTNAELASLTTL